MTISKFLYFSHCVTVHSLNDFTEIINYCGNELNHLYCIDNYKQYLPSKIFYRGEPRYHGSTSNVAGIYRNSYQESALYHAYMRRFYRLFKNMDDFSKLTYMQHYGLPTCLLDITSNSLVSLYFACSKIYNCSEYCKNLRTKFASEGKCTKDSYIWKDDNKYNGIVYMIIPKRKPVTFNLHPYVIYNNYSDSISILSTLALLKNNTQNKLLNDFFKFNKFILDVKGQYAYTIFYILYINGRVHESIYKRDNYPVQFSFFKRNMKDLKNNKLTNNFNIDFSNLDLHSNKLNKLCNKFIIIAKKYFKLSHSYEMTNLIHKIRQNVGDFNSTINLINILRPRIVQPALNNRRVEAQQGYFIFENRSNSRNDDPQNILKDLKKYYDILKIVIPNECKESMLKELDKNFNINEETLFPDTETVADYMGKIFKQHIQEITNVDSKYRVHRKYFNL